MGIKDKVLDILFDDDDEQNIANHQGKVKHDKQNVDASSFLDTGSVFIDATSPLPKAKPMHTPNSNEQQASESKTADVSGYQMSENISPIFGPIDGKNKKNKNLSKIKSYNDISNKTFDTNSKNQIPTYTSVVISPIYGPISIKATKKGSKPRKKATDPFDRDINDTGSFDTILSESDEEILEPQFDEADEQDTVVEQTSEKIGDTDRLVRISDKINRIKNEAAIIYNDSDESDTISEDDYKVETFEPSTISGLIHDVQNHDEKIEHKPIVVDKPEDTIDTQEEIQPEDSSNNTYITPDSSNNNTFETTEEEAIETVTKQSTGNVETFEELDQSDDFISNKPNNEAKNTDSSVQASVDDLFEDEDVEEGKDLFSVLFGDD